VKKFSPATYIFALLSPQDRLAASKLVLAMLITAIIDVMGVASILPFMALAAKPEIVQTNSWMQQIYVLGGFASPNRFLFFAGAIFFLLLVASNFFSALTAWMMFRFAFSLEHRFAERMLKSYLSRPYEFFLAGNTSIMARNILTECATAVGGAVVPGLQLLARSVVVFFVLILLMAVDPALALVVALVLGGAYAGAYLFIRRKLLANGRRSNDANAEAHKAATEALHGVKEIRLAGMEKAFLSRFSAASLDNSHFKVKGFTLSLLPRYVIETVAFGGMLLILLYLIGVKRDVTNALPLIALYALAGYRLLPALQQIFQSLSQIRYSFASLEVLNRELAGEVAGQELEEASQQLEVGRGIELLGVSYAYPGTGAPVLHDISLSIAANTSVALVGATGSGKTTLLDIVSGILLPGSGEIRIDGRKLDANVMREWQASIGYVPQSIYLTDDTIARNIAFGCAGDNIRMEDVERAAKAAKLHEFITAELPDGYATLVGERGVRLSGGQRQRIGIARALYRKPGMLIMDEATSALDGITERAVIDAIQELSHKLTIITVAHRLTTVRDCDVIYLLDKGHVAFRGSFAELSASNDIFQNMLNPR